MKSLFKNPFTILQAWIDKTVMYLLVLYMLSILAISAVIAGSLGLVGPTAIAQAGTLLVVLITAYGMSQICARSTGIAANHHSSVITGLILFFLILPATTVLEYGVIMAVVTIAIASKYVLVYRKQHIVNPAALAVWLLALSGYGVATWWVATLWLLPVIVVTGTIVVLKIRKWVPVLSFLTVGCAVFLLEGLYYGDAITSTWTAFFISYPALFLGFFMLTEPFTMPPTKRLQAGYGALVGLLSNTSLLRTVITLTPELALLIGNVVSFGTTLRQKLFLILQSKSEIAAGTWEFVFAKPTAMTFKAGQYLEWMLPHMPADSRGIRRYFTIASSPTEDTIRLALKVTNPGSSYKAALMELPVGGTLLASQRAGDFILPTDTSRKIAMVAGGIGVTPFRSQVQYLLDTQAKADVILFYCCNTKADLAYNTLWNNATASTPFVLVPVLAKEPTAAEYEVGYFSAEIVKRHMTDYLERMWYVSGPPPMVDATVATLRILGVPTKHIVQDFFPGLA